MKKITQSILAFLLITVSTQQVSAITIHTIGDSTMADYEESSTDKRGWGMMLQPFFTSDITINNRAKSGASSKSFYRETAYWNTVKPQIKSGDYVFIQFAHNDEKNNGLDGDDVILTDPTADYRGTSAQGSYKTFLRAYINESRALGATPVLVTPICRKYFSAGAITRKGRHDLGENFGVPITDHTYDYVFAMKEVAVEQTVELIDLTQLSKTMFESYGDADCTSLLFCKDDSTHPNAMGATLISRLCANAMANQNILASYINASADILVSPTSGNFGQAYTGQTLTKEFSISGFDINPANGTFELSVSEGYSIAKSKTEAFSSSISLTYSNANLDFQRFYVAVNLTQAGTKEGILTITNGTTTKNIPLTATCIELIGGTEVKLFWKLESNTDYVLTGPATPVAESFSQMGVSNYAAPNASAVWPTSSGYDASRKTQRNLIDGGAWPAGEVDEVSTRYIQFGITANAGTELYIDSIGLYVCGAGGNGMRCRISYSTNNFSDYTAIKEFPSMVSNNVYAVDYKPTLKLNAGETMYLRVYPWYSSAATGKTICLADVCIHGLAMSAPTAVAANEMDNVKCITNSGHLRVTGVNGPYVLRIFDLTGKKINESAHQNGNAANVAIAGLKGIYICEIQSGTGTKALKFMVK